MQLALVFFFLDYLPTNYFDMRSGATTRSAWRWWDEFLSPYTGTADQGYGRGGTPVFNSVFEPVARVTLFLTDEYRLGTCFGSA